MRSTLFALAGAASGALGQQFLFTGANEAGGEFGEANLPGALGTDYTWPDASAIDVSAVMENVIVPS